MKASLNEQQVMDQIHILGQPNITLNIEGGIHGDTATTAMHCQWRGTHHESTTWIKNDGRYGHYWLEWRLTTILLYTLSHLFETFHLVDFLHHFKAPGQ